MDIYRYIQREVGTYKCGICIETHRHTFMHTNMHAHIYRLTVLYTETQRHTNTLNAEKQAHIHMHTQE